MGEVLRFLLWRLLGLLALIAGLALISWFLQGGPGELLRGDPAAGDHLGAPAFVHALAHVALSCCVWIFAQRAELAAVLCALTALLVAARTHARGQRCYVRLQVEPYRTDHAAADEVIAMLDALHKRLLVRWWRRLISGQPSLALEVHRTGDDARRLWMALTCPCGSERVIETALQAAYPNCRLVAAPHSVGRPPVLLRLKKHAEFIKRVKALDGFEHGGDPPMNSLLTVMASCEGAAFTQIALTPTPALFEGISKHLYKHHEARLSRQRRDHVPPRDRSVVEDAELKGALAVQHSSLFFTDVRVIASDRRTCVQVASQLRAGRAENRLVERGTGVRHGLLGMYTRRVMRGEGNPLPSFLKGVFASAELAAMWQLPSPDYLTAPFRRSGLPVAPAPSGVFRPIEGSGTLRDAHGAVSIHEEMRKQNTAVPGTVEQGKTSYLVATVAEDLRRERCAVILLDPKGDAADAAVSIVPSERTCTLLDLAHPTCGFNPLAVQAPADVIADYVVAALKTLFTDSDIRASSDRYLRNAIIAVLAYDRQCTLWDAARLLSVGEEGYAYRSAVAARIRTLPEFKEISEFFTAELSAQLADSRSTTTAKLDAPVNKLARLLNSPSIKRVLLNDSLAVDFDRVIANGEVLVVKGALGGMGAGNTSVVMQLLVGMLDAALARQQDLVAAERRVAVALKVDEAPLVINRGFAETMALKRSAGLETVACWQTDAQWTEREVRDQLDALFAHRVYFATASARDARAASALTMAEFTDTVRPGLERLSTLGHPDVRLHLPKHHAVASWVTADGRQPPFVAATIPISIDRERLARHAKRQHERGARHRSDLRQPHWQHQASADDPAPRAGERAVNRSASIEAHGRSSVEALQQLLPGTPAESYRELVELDGANSARWARRPDAPTPLEPDQHDLEMLVVIAAMGHVLASQLHRRFNPRRSASTTQRRLKRLSDAGLVDRLQFHRRDGGGTPMCYVITPAGRSALERAGRDAVEPDGGGRRTSGSERTAAVAGALRQARHDVHVAGWVFALTASVRGSHTRVRGPRECVLSPASGGRDGAASALAPGELRLPGGRTAHDFLKLDGAGDRVPVERFETVRPDALVEVASSGAARAAIDLIVELDDRLPTGPSAAKLERYDHFLAGWSAHTRRYGTRLDALAVVVFVCRDRSRARACARAADAVLSACRAYAGEYPQDWQYPGRERIVFVAERDAHEGLLGGYGVPRLPPDVRIGCAHGDPRVGEASPLARELLLAVA